jgi:hypothetical protein
MTLQFCRDLQVFWYWLSGQERPSVCYYSVNQLLEPRSGCG